MVTAAEATAILEEPKVIGVNVRWRQDGRTHKLEATVLSESGETLKLYGFIGKKNRSFALLYRNTPIRKYTVHDRHTDPVTGQRVIGPHKHTWDDVWRDQRVYLPEDIRVGDVNDEFKDFLAECNIQLRGAYYEFVQQLSLL